jgi:anthranilate phosphoribosyltransferase
MGEVMEGNVAPVQLAGFLVALADTMVAHARPLEVSKDAVDIVGTGGDLAQTVNISTMSAVVVAATGRRVVKHGNRASSSRSGSADCLEALGIRLDLPVPAVQRIAGEVGITFLFAQVFHPSMRFAAEARKGLGIPTVFNVLGPITNPGRPRAGAVGVADRAMAPTVASVFAERGTSALVFRGQDGLDELSIAAPSDVWEVRGGEIREHVLDPGALLGMPRHDVDSLRGGDAEENAAVAREVFAGQGRASVRDAVLLNAAAGILAHDAIGSAPDDRFEDRFVAAAQEARGILEAGAATQLVDRWIAASRDV